ncbi:basic amino acid ABC transporter substrate-binding protein [Brevibacillus fluminis]|uniref:Basic amino acid ABC transporter substrate-binding protein n=1 Tax=Brevibacillus fluminis TaxID=511487 RepID=A0A3M8DXZ7_9BACL|nr:basic amino acid ABC transporter substrate-binding protein [Brevibacillus fluminis]RNB92399.1 basic amino acid ABC transporter substrate-binding protein [Brevibacillus fluminis]
MIHFKKWLAAGMVGLVALNIAGCGSKQEATGSSADAKVVTIATTNDGPPFAGKENGKLIGYDIELVEAIAKKANVQMEWKEMKFDGIIPALQAKQVDGAVSAITIREDRKQVVDFTDPYFQSGLSIVVAKNSPIQKLEDLNGKTIVAKQGTSGLETAQKLAEQYGAKVKILQDDATLFLDVESGNSDALINDFPMVAYKIKVDGDATKLRVMGDRLTGEEYGIAIVKGNKELLDKFNKGLKELKDSGEFQKLYDKYFGTN